MPRNFILSLIIIPFAYACSHADVRGYRASTEYLPITKPARQNESRVSADHSDSAVIETSDAKLSKIGRQRIIADVKASLGLFK